MATPTTNIKAVITAEDKASAVLKKFGISGAISLAAVTKASTDAFKAFEVQELAVTRLAAGIKNVKSATDDNIDSLLAQATALQKVTRFSDEAIISSQGILSTFQLNQAQIETLTPRLLDMAEGLARVDGTMPDLEGNAILVAKALGGEDVTGLAGALRRVGVIMTDTQMEVLKTGDMEERLAVITQVLDQNYQGLAVAAGETTAGAVARLRNQFGELQEKIGELMANALRPLLDFMIAHPAVLQAVTIAVGALAVAFVVLKVKASLALIEIAASARTATGAVAALSATSLTAWAIGIAGAAAIVAPALNSIYGAKGMIDKKNAEITTASEAILAKLQASGNTAEAARFAAEWEKMKGQLKNPFSFLPFAEGGNVPNNNPILVGEQGPEIFYPNRSGGTVIPNDGLGGTFNVSINVGVYAGSDIEMRKLSQTILQSLKDIASAKGKTLNQLMGV
jgi:hypothetical protein